MPKPIITALNDTAICNGNANEVAQLNATGAQKYQWIPCMGLSNPSISNPVATLSATTTYVVTGTAADGCFARETVTIYILPKAVITASNDTSICVSSTGSTAIKLNATGMKKYQWSPFAGLSNPSISNPLATVSNTTTYVVTGTSASGCYAKDTVVINVLPNPVITVSNDTLICVNSSARLRANGGNQYKWSPSTGLNNANIPNPVATPLQSTKYFVTVTANNSCSSQDSVEINVKPAAVFSVKQINTTFCQGSTIQLQASGGDTYLWQTAQYLSNTVISNPIAKPDTTTTYKYI